MNNLTEKVIIRDNHRFETGHATHEDAQVFYKRSHIGIDALKREIEGLRKFNKIARSGILPFNVPKLINHDEDTVIAEYIEGIAPKFITGDTDFTAFFIDSFVAIDELTRNAQPKPSRYSHPNNSGQMIWQILENDIRACDEHLLIGEDRLQACVDYLKSNHSSLEARFMHADFTDNNLLRDETGNYWLIDYESCADDWPRWYNVVNFTYNRRMKYPELESEMKYILRTVISKCGPGLTTYDEIRFIVILRGLSLIIEHMTEPNDSHATNDKMNPELYARVLQSIDSCLNGSIEQWLK